MPLVHAGSGAAAKVAEIKIGLIGCGGRGTGAILDALGAATKVIYPSEGYHTEDVAEGAKSNTSNIKVVALADLFEDRLDRTRGELGKLGIDIARNRCFTGFDAYKQLLEIPEINYVILATPPHFRPIHLKAAIEAGKNAFIEKPAAVDVPGIHLVIEAGELAKKKGLGIAAGTQRRHQKSYIETIKRIKDGAIGDILYAKAYWNGGQIWVVDKESPWSDIEWQIRNWNYFTWLGGDHIVEQHVHNLDVMNWVIGTPPDPRGLRPGRAAGTRGRSAGTYLRSLRRRIRVPRRDHGLQPVPPDQRLRQHRRRVRRRHQGHTATAPTGSRRRGRRAAGGTAARSPSPYHQEHQDLIASILAGNPINEAQTVAESTLTGIIGREAVYSGHAITWDEAIRSKTKLGPGEYKFGPYPIPPVAIPGQYKFV